MRRWAGRNQRQTGPRRLGAADEKAKGLRDRIEALREELAKPLEVPVTFKIQGGGDSFYDVQEIGGGTGTTDLQRESAKRGRPER